MGRKMKAKKREIEIRFEEPAISPEEQKYRNETLSQVIFRMFKDLSGREPTYKEVTGQVEMRLDKRILRQK